MTPKRSDSAEEILKDKTGAIARLRKLGITDFAIITYVVRVQDGQPKDEALRGLLQGRSLSEEQVQFVRTVLERFPIR
jgi:hypothetical protein